MSKMLVVVFDDEGKAFEGSRALTQLHREGSISAYAGAIVARDANGKISIKDEVDEGPIGTAVGMLTGALIGMLAGPEGMVVGAAAGTMIGSTADLINLGVGTDFLDEVGGRLEPGKVAVVAEVSENWVTPVDTRMEELGGTVYRKFRIDVEDEQIERDIQATKAEYNELEEELEAAREEDKAALKSKVEKAQQKLSAAGDRAKAKIDSLKDQADAKVKSVEAQIASAKDEAKTKLEARKAEIKSDYETRSGKLKQAWELTREAVAA